MKNCLKIIGVAACSFWSTHIINAKAPCKKSSYGEETIKRHMAISREPSVVSQIRWCQSDQQILNREKEKNVKNGQKRSKWSKMVKNDQNGPPWSKFIINCPKWLKMAKRIKKGPKWSEMAGLTLNGPDVEPLGPRTTSKMMS